jgi:Arc/MetJ family transcription regulator
MEASMRTTLAINEELLNEAKELSGARTKKEAVEVALEEFIRRRKAKKLLELEGKIELSFTLDEFLKDRKRDVPHR